MLCTANWTLHLSLLGLVLASSASCRRSGTSDELPAAERPATPPKSHSPPHSKSSAARAHRARAGKLPAGTSTKWGDYCTKDADCGWDDPCVPRACGTAKPRGGANCEETAPPPGSCECVASRCTLRPKKLEASTSTAMCARNDECAVDVRTATCRVVENPSHQKLQQPLRVEGPLCTCDKTTKHCQLQWSAKVPRKSFRDCAWSDDPVMHPVRATPPRTKKFRPCKDGERDSMCVPDPDGAGKICRVVVWKC